jgi:hypothetical protein
MTKVCLQAIRFFSLLKNSMACPWHMAHGTRHTAHVAPHINISVSSAQHYSCTEHRNLPVNTAQCVNDVTVYCAVRQLLTDCFGSPLSCLPWPLSRKIVKRTRAVGWSRDMHVCTKLRCVQLLVGGHVQCSQWRIIDYNAQGSK